MQHSCTFVRDSTSGICWDSQFGHTHHRVHILFLPRQHLMLVSDGVLREDWGGREPSHTTVEYEALLGFDGSRVVAAAMKHKVDH